MEDKKLQEKDLGQVSGGKLEITLPTGGREYVVTIKSEDGEVTRVELIDFLCNEMRSRGESVSPQDSGIDRSYNELDEMVKRLKDFPGFPVYARAVFTRSGRLFSIEQLY